MDYRGKEILVLGLGRSGLAATRLLQQAGAAVTIVDSGNSEALEQRAETLRAEGMRVLLAKESSSFQACYDCAILSPGIDPTSPLVQEVIAKGIPLVGEIELAYHFCKCPIVAITGTNGKTTTTELTVAGLLGAGLKTIACGNIGLPFSEAVLKSGEMDVLVIELSSFQLETTDQFHAKVAVWLNLSPNHLDRYASMAEYKEAKLRIFRNQESVDFIVVPSSFNTGEISNFTGRQLTFSSRNSKPENPPSSMKDRLSSCMSLPPFSSQASATLNAGSNFFFDGESIYYGSTPLLVMSQTQLCGAHNAENMMAALAVGVALAVDPQKMVKELSQYRSLPHRCEVVAEKGGVLWVNDSKSTTLDAMQKALQSMDRSRPIILVAGGKNKGSSFSSILPLVEERVKIAILLGEMKGSIAKAWPSIVSHQVNSMEEAVQVAATHAEPGDIVLLSPGTSSYDMFSNYEERGNQFKRAVQKI